MSKPFLAPTPPLGWNSYDCYGGSVNEREFRANVDYLAEKLLHLGYRYACIDGGWTYEEAPQTDFVTDHRAHPNMDEYGRLRPNVNRFPSAADGSFAKLADYVHSRGLKFGIHVMRGIPRPAVDRDLPVFGTKLTAAQIADKQHLCEWSNTMYGLQSGEGGRAYYRSILSLYAAWGVDFIKVDDMGIPYFRDEIDAFADAVETCGRPILLSLSPGIVLDEILRTHDHVASRCHMWRITVDMWDNWLQVRHLFPLLAAWSGVIGPDSWPDADMLPYGTLSIKSPKSRGGRPSKLTEDELRTHFTLLCMARSPLLIGSDLPRMDKFTYSIVTNPEVLAVNQYSRENRCPWSSLTGTIGWTARMADGDAIVAMFNISDEVQEFSPELGWLRIAPGRYKVRDLWEHKELPPIEGEFKGSLRSHACLMYRLTKM